MSIEFGATILVERVILFPRLDAGGQLGTRQLKVTISNAAAGSRIALALAVPVQVSRHSSFSKFWLYQFWLYQFGLHNCM